MDYWFEKDYGAGIYNEGLCICNNCTFSYNYCKYGAGIYSTGALFLNNNTFIGNCAYKEGSNVAVDGGTVYLDGEKVEENNPQITFTHTATRILVNILAVVSAGAIAVGGIAAAVGVALSLSSCAMVGAILFIVGGLMIIPILYLESTMEPTY